MRIAIAFLASVLAASAAEIQIVIVRDDKSVSTATITTTDATLAAINQWRQKQVSGKDAEGVDILKYPTRQSLYKGILVDAIQRILEQEPSAAMATERAKRIAAEAAEKAAKEGAVQ